MNPQTMTIYGCGGCGINQTYNFVEACKVHDTNSENGSYGFAELSPVYCDTSRSNLTKDRNISEEHCSIIPDRDGSGKVRKHNAEVIVKQVEKVLETHRPSTFNVIIYSTGGGTGSVFGPVLAQQLTRQGIPHIQIIISDIDSSQTAKNTYDVITGLNAQANRTAALRCHQIVVM